ncbi:MAG TPA: Hpt domain-containing protein [Devosia sp.]|jgi:HPt (histidine-containing phosphotransfer) domain-containing protein|nr:Hpt domain-containing protein [Devosia sp.]
MRGENAAKALPLDPVQPEIRRPIDMEHLSRQTLGDPGLELEVLRLFDEMSHTYYERLETSTNVDDLLRNLHTLRGAAAGIGAFGLADLARVAETELRAGAPVNPERIDDLAVAVQEVSAFISERLDHADAA